MTDYQGGCTATFSCRKMDYPRTPLICSVFFRVYDISYTRGSFAISLAIVLGKVRRGGVAHQPALPPAIVHSIFALLGQWEKKPHLERNKFSRTVVWNKRGWLMAKQVQDMMCVR